MYLPATLFYIYIADVPCNVDNCSQGCANINGTETCFCMPGYQLNMDNVTCSGKYDHNSYYTYKRIYCV